MELKTYLQLFLFSVIIFISTVFFKTYFLDNNVKEKKVSFSKEKKIKKVNNNTIENIGYTSEDGNGNKYYIESEFTDFNNSQSNLVIMENVVATIDLKNSSPIKIFSKKAHYDNINFDTHFFNGVTMKYDEHVIKSDIVNLNFEKNFVTISGNVIYNDINTVMETDKIEIDLITKNSKIFMNDKEKKIQIKNTN
tara:strand:- start:712 stop:1293 length:582 start_codon:yes stop_codon:yes gene_type:complete